MDEIIGKNLLKLRKKAKLTRVNLVSQLDNKITGQQLAKYEAGINRLPITRMFDICKALNCSILEVLNGLDLPGKDQALQSILRILKNG